MVKIKEIQTDGTYTIYDSEYNFLSSEDTQA